jgi:mycoredoxin
MTQNQIVMYTRPGCEDSDAAREFLNHRHIPFIEVNIDEDPAAVEFVKSVNEGKKRTPTFKVAGRTFHCSQFDPGKLARELGLADAATTGQQQTR